MPAVIQQRRGGFFIAVVAFDMTDKNHVIAAIVLRFAAAFKTGAATDNQRRVTSTNSQIQSGKFIHSRTGKAP